MDIEKNIALVIANRKKESPPYTFRAIGCNNFPKPLTDESIDLQETAGANNIWRYDFNAKVNAIIELLPTDPGYNILEPTKEVELLFGIYLFVGLRWKLYDTETLSPKEIELLQYLNNLPQTSTGMETVELESRNDYQGIPVPIEYDYNEVEDEKPNRRWFKATPI